MKTEQVVSGQAATAPTAPNVDGFAFVGWDKDFSNITGSLTVTAVYERVYTSPTFIVENVSAQKGETVTVAVNVKNNPGILAMTLSLAYDESAMTLVSASNGEALAALTMTASRNLTSGCKFGWDGVEISDGDIADGEILVLTFQVKNNAVAGEYDIEISYNAGDIMDNNLNTLSFNIENGTVTVG